jgi:hypothetical protein
MIQGVYQVTVIVRFTRSQSLVAYQRGPAPQSEWNILADRNDTRGLSSHSHSQVYQVTVTSCRSHIYQRTRIHLGVAYETGSMAGI